MLLEPAAARVKAWYKPKRSKQAWPVETEARVEDQSQKFSPIRSQKCTSNLEQPGSACWSIISVLLSIVNVESQDQNLIIFAKLNILVEFLDSPCLSLVTTDLPEQLVGQSENKVRTRTQQRNLNWLTEQKKMICLLMNFKKVFAPPPPSPDALLPFFENDFNEYLLYCKHRCKAAERSFRKRNQLPQKGSFERPRRAKSPVHVQRQAISNFNIKFVACFILNINFENHCDSTARLNWK